MTIFYDQYATAAKKIIAAVGKKIIIGIPLGLGKPVGLMNALYTIAANDSSIHLTILTALTLSRPAFGNTFNQDLEKRFVEPFLNRVLKDYEDLLYEKAREKQQLPKNINVIEFFLSTAKFLHNDYVQQNYINTTYTNASRDVAAFGLNVIAQQVSRNSDNPDQYSLSCNSDLFHDVVKHLQKSKKKFAVVAEVNNNLPFMHGDAVIESQEFTDIVDTQHYRTLFSVPHDEISIEDHLIGFYTSTLIKDDSCLQIGIGKLSNALTYSLIMRHKENVVYQQLIQQFQVKEKFGETIAKNGELNPFNKGLYASTEMLCDGYLQLYQENILKKRVYDHIGLQRLLNRGEISEQFSSDILDKLMLHKIINPELTAHDVDFLIKFGIIHTSVRFAAGTFILSDGEKIPANLNQAEAKKKIIARCLGKKLKGGHIIHAAFFLGSSDLYQGLNGLSPAELEEIDMTSVARTNSILWQPELLSLQRQDCRFVNSAMMVTLGSVIISDGLENMREVSGVGGQFDFVDMASHLEGSRSIINCRSVRYVKSKANSNIVWEYSNATIPRFLRDMVVTEYGIADCRSKTDSDVIKTMLNVTDSRFQAGLLKKAKLYGKVEPSYEIPDIFRNNYPEKFQQIISAFQTKGYFNPYPFGTEFTSEELVLKNALLFLKDNSALKLPFILLCSLFYFKSDTVFLPYLNRMQLTKPKHFKEYIAKKLLKYTLRRFI